REKSLGSPAHHGCRSAFRTVPPDKSRSHLPWVSAQESVFQGVSVSAGSRMQARRPSARADPPTIASCRVCRVRATQEPVRHLPVQTFPRSDWSWTAATFGQFRVGEVAFVFPNL